MCQTYMGQNISFRSSANKPVDWVQSGFKILAVCFLVIVFAYAGIMIYETSVFVYVILKAGLAAAWHQAHWVFHASVVMAAILIGDCQLFKRINLNT